MNISQHSFVPLSFLKGYYNSSKNFLEDNFDTYCCDLFRVDNCNSCVVFRQLGSTSNRVGGTFRFFDKQLLVDSVSILDISNFPFSFTFDSSNFLELSVSCFHNPLFVYFLVFFV